MTNSPSPQAVSLRECPFCGGEAKQTSVRDGRVIYCVACSAKSGPAYHGRDGWEGAEVRAIAAWNSRASPADGVVPLPTLEQIARVIDPDAWEHVDSCHEAMKRADDTDLKILRSVVDRRLRESGSIAVAEKVSALFEAASPALAATSVGEADLPPISLDGPHRPNTHRRWLSRKLLDSKLTDDEAYGIVRCHPAISDTPPSADADKLREAVRLALEDADALDRTAEDADENQWPDWSATMRQAAGRIRALARLSTTEAGG